MNANRYRPTQAAAVIISPDAMGAALLGAAIEVAGVKAAFPPEGESPQDCVRRLRPAYVLIGCDDSLASDESLLGPSMMIGARIFLFGADRRIRMRKHIALRFHLGVLVLPGDVDRIATILSLPSAASPAANPVGQ